MRVVNRGLSYTTYLYSKTHISYNITNDIYWHNPPWYLIIMRHLLRHNTYLIGGYEQLPTTNQSRLFAWNSSLLATSLTSTCSNSEYTKQGSLTRISHERKARIDCRIPIYSIDSSWFRFDDDATSQLIKTCGYETGISKYQIRI